MEVRQKYLTGFRAKEEKVLIAIKLGALIIWYLKAVILNIICPTRNGFIAKLKCCYQIL
jgi:hypothetical protein